ncbi:MAG: GTP-binding protein, partial [Actinobacteria bacterium]|nr:GTP-binding protein [Actinomycetota bacterium]
MGTKTPTNTPVPQATAPAEIRNVVLVGHSGAGKTTLFEHLLATTTPGYRAKPILDERSVQLAVACVAHEGVTLNLIDTPGYPDFVGELRAGLRAADAALFVISAADGVDGATLLLWEECAAIGMPRAVAVTKLDAGRADFEDTVAICQRVFGEGVMALYLPLHGDDDAIVGNVGLLSQQIYDYSSGEPAVHAAEDKHRELIEGHRADLIEAIIQESEDDTLLDRYLEGEDIDVDLVVADLLTAVSRGRFHPVIPVSTETGVGTVELLQLLTDAFPAPNLHPLPAVMAPNGDPLPPLTCDPDGPLVAEVVRTTSDPYVGRVSVVRVFSGTLRPDSVVHVSGHLDRVVGGQLEGHAGHDDDERVGLLSSPLGDTLRPKAFAIAGDLCVVAKLTKAETTDTLSNAEIPALIEPW